ACFCMCALRVSLISVSAVIISGSKTVSTVTSAPIRLAKATPCWTALPASSDPSVGIRIWVYIRLSSIYRSVLRCICKKENSLFGAIAHDKAGGLSLDRPGRREAVQHWCNTKLGQIVLCASCANSTGSSTLNSLRIMRHAVAAHKVEHRGEGITGYAG